MAISVTLVGDRDRALEEQLRAAGMRPVTIPATELAALVHPSNPSPEVVVLDLRTHGQIPPALALLKRQHPDAAVVILAPALEPTLMLEAMRAGVSEYVTDVTRGDLEAAIVRLVAARRVPDSGEVFAFIGAKGGVGTTTAAVNVSTALAKVGSVLLIDMHLSGGDAALYLGADPRFSVADALENTHRLDAAYFRSIVVRTKAGPDVLASADRALSGSVDQPRVRALLEFAARHYRYTLVDLTRSDVVLIDSIDAITKIVVVANQELATVRGAVRLVPMLRQRHGREKVEVVLSRSDSKSEIGLNDLQKAAGGAIKHVFPSDYRLAVDALNRGRPLAMDNQNPLASAFIAYARDLAGLTSEERITEKADKGQSGLFGRLTGRR